MKSCNGTVRRLPNHYYKGLVEDEPYIRGYMAAVRDLEGALSENLNDGERSIDELERNIQKDFIQDVEDSMNYYIDETNVCIINGLDDAEYQKRMKQIFGDEYKLEEEDDIDFNKIESLKITVSKDELKQLLNQATKKDNKNG